MRNWLWRPIFGGLTTLIALLGHVPHSPAQLSSRRGVSYSVTLPTPPREYQQALSRARRAIDEEQYSDAIEALVELLGTPGNEDFFVETEKDGVRKSLKSAARDLLGALPKAGLEVYELQFGVEARQLLEQAVEGRDLQMLTDVSRRFFHTKAGYDATFLLGKFYLDQQRFLAAAMTLERLSGHRAAGDRYGEDLSLLLAMSWRLAGDSSKASKELRLLKQRSPDAAFSVAGKDVSIFSGNVDPLVWLDQVVGKQAGSSTTSVEQWALFRGDAARNAVTRGGMPLPGLQWRVDVCPESVDDEATVRRIWKASLEDDEPAIVALYPLAVGDYVLMRTVDGIYGVDVNTGKRIWPYPWFEPNQTAASHRVGLPQVNNPQEMQRAAELKRRVWEDLPQGQLSSDGQLVYAVYGTNPTLTSQRGFGGFNRGRLPNGNQLVALELATQGKIRWLLGGEDGDAPELMDAYFMGPPLPLGERLYVIVELKDEIKLLVLDAETGKTVWSQQLGHIDAPYVTTFSDRRRLVGASPSFADGVLVCPTSAGAVVALDLATRSLLWGTECKKSTPFSHRVDRNALKTNPRWADGSAAIANGRVLITPVDTGNLYCLDLLTGEEVWKPMARHDGVYVAGVEHDTIVIVGKRDVRGVKLSDGTDAWDERLKIPGGAMPSGRGFISGGDYFLPTTADQIIRFRISDGTIVEVVDSDYPLGNLVCYRDKVLSQAPDALYAFSQRERMRELMPRRLAETPNDPRTLEDNARLLINDGKHDEAIEQLRRALTLYGDEESLKVRAKSLLVNVMLSVLRQDFDKADYRDELERIIVDPRQRLEFYRISANGLAEQGDYMAAFEVYLKLSKLKIPASDEFDDMDGLEEVAADHHVRRDVWLRRQFADLWRRAGDDDRQQMQTRIAETVTAAMQSADNVDRADALEFFLDRPEAQSLLPRIAQDEIDAERYLSAERWLTYLEDHGDANDSVDASRQLIALYRSLLRLDNVYEQLVRTRREWPDGVSAEGQTGREIAAVGLKELLAETGPGVVGPGQLARWPTGRVEQIDKLPVSDRGRAQATELLSVEMRAVRGAWNPDNRVLYDKSGHNIVVLDGDGAAQVKVPVSQPQSRQQVSFYSGTHDLVKAKAYGHLLIVSLGYEILAINLLDDVEGRPSARVLWRERVVSQESGSATTLSRQIENGWVIDQAVPMDKNGRRVGMIGPVSATGVCYQRINELRCVDPLTGDVRWTRKGIPIGCSLFGDEEYVFISRLGSDVATVYAMSDGTKVGERAVPIDNRRWLTVGRNVLTWDGQHGDGADLTLRMVDVWDDREAWQHVFADESRGFVIDNDELVIMQPDGRLVVLGLADGQIRLETNLLPEKLLTYVFAIRSQDQYLFVTHRPIQTGRTSANRRNFGGSYHASLGATRRVNGRVYAYDRQTSRPMWPVPAEIDGYKLPLSQAANSPLLLFLRYPTPTIQTRNNRRTQQRQTEILCLDRRDGRRLTQSQPIVGGLALHGIEAFPEERQVVVELRGNHGIILAYTDKPRPPAAPLQSSGDDGKTSDAADRAGRAADLRGLQPNPGGLQIQAGGRIQLNGGRVKIEVEIGPNGGNVKVREKVEDGGIEDLFPGDR